MCARNLRDGFGCTFGICARCTNYSWDHTGFHAPHSLHFNCQVFVLRSFFSFFLNNIVIWRDGDIDNGTGLLLFVFDDNIWFVCWDASVCLDLSVPDNCNICRLGYWLRFVLLPFITDSYIIMFADAPMKMPSNRIVAFDVLFICKNWAGIYW